MGAVPASRSLLLQTDWRGQCPPNRLPRWVRYIIKAVRNGHTNRDVVEALHQPAVRSLLGRDHPPLNVITVVPSEEDALGEGSYVVAFMAVVEFNHDVDIRDPRWVSGHWQRRSDRPAKGKAGGGPRPDTSLCWERQSLLTRLLFLPGAHPVLLRAPSACPAFRACTCGFHVPLARAVGPGHFAKAQQLRDRAWRAYGRGEMLASDLRLWLNEDPLPRSSVPAPLYTWEEGVLYLGATWRFRKHLIESSYAAPGPDPLGE